MLSYIRRIGPFLGVQILNFNIGGRGGRKMNLFWGVGCGYDGTVDIFLGGWGWGRHRKWTIFGSFFLNILGLF